MSRSYRTLIARHTRFLAIATCLALSPIASAGPMTLSDVIGAPGYEAIEDDPSLQAARLDDTDGVLDDSNFLLMMEGSPYALSNSFGIYGFGYNLAGDVVLGDELEVFAGYQQPGFGFFPTVATLLFDLENETVQNLATGLTANIGALFGFYMDTPAGGGTRVYSHDDLNADGQDAVLMFDTRSMSFMVGGADLILAFDAGDGFGDGQFNDMVIGLTDVTPVPTPGSLVFLALGLTGLFRRRLHI